MITAGFTELQLVNELILHQLKMGVNTCIPGIIKEFNITTQQAVVQPAIRERVRIDDYIIDIDPDILFSVPVIFPRGGNFLITLPIQVSDTCLLMFSQRALDNWDTSERTLVNPEDGAVNIRCFDKTDAICLPGLFSQHDIVTEYAANDLVLRSLDDKIKIVLSSGGVTIHNQDITFSVDYEGRIDGSLTVTGNLNIGTGATGIFTALGGKRIEVMNGVIVGIQ